jgi:NAD(P)-dependent dehydrogenase (short-subunit alcohol dehydrogenase family)
VRPLDEQTVLITGATDGLGRATARALARRGAAILVHGRSSARVQETARELRDENGDDRVLPYVADLASLAEVTRVAAEVEAAHDHLDVLINNAGIVAEERQLSPDGHELTFAVNYLSHFLLTELLLPLLRRAGSARIVNVASIGQSPLDFDDVMLERGYDGFTAYAQSKLAQVLFTVELAERLAGEGENGVTVNALHPATLMDTKMARETFGRAHSSVGEGVEALVRLAVSEDVEGVTGRYFDGLEESSAHPQAYDVEARRRLWGLSEALTRPHGG